MSELKKEQKDKVKIALRKIATIFIEYEFTKQEVFLLIKAMIEISKEVDEDFK